MLACTSLQDLGISSDCAIAQIQRTESCPGPRGGCQHCNHCASCCQTHMGLREWSILDPNSTKLSPEGSRAVCFCDKLENSGLQSPQMWDHDHRDRQRARLHFLQFEMTSFSRGALCTLLIDRTMSLSVCAAKTLATEKRTAKEN
jgi:hypothetical protein